MHLRVGGEERADPGDLVGRVLCGLGCLVFPYDFFDAVLGFVVEAFAYDAYFLADALLFEDGCDVVGGACCSSVGGDEEDPALFFLFLGGCWEAKEDRFLGLASVGEEAVDCFELSCAPGGGPPCFPRRVFFAAVGESDPSGGGQQSDAVGAIGPGDHPNPGHETVCE